MATKPRNFLLRDAAQFISVLTGVCFLFVSGSSIYMAYRTVEDSRKAIVELQEWRHSHEVYTSRRVTELEELQRRIDSCCPRWRFKIDGTQ